MLYHVSQTAGLRTLTPHVSTHGKPWVYATENMVTALLFGAKVDDFDFFISTDEVANPEIFECYPDALQKVYSGKRCSVYEVSAEGFLRNMTSWDVELVCENEVAVQKEIAVSNLYETLLEQESRGNLKIHRYELSEEYRKRIARHIVDRLIRFGIDFDHCAEHDARFATHYKKIIEALRSVTDGHLLA